MGIVRTNGTSGPDLQRLVAGVEGRNGKMGFKFGFIFQRALQGGVKFSLAAETLGDASGVSCQQHIERNRGSIDGCIGFVVPRKINVATSLD